MQGILSEIEAAEKARDGAYRDERMLFRDLARIVSHKENAPEIGVSLKSNCLRFEEEYLRAESELSETRANARAVDEGKANVKNLSYEISRLEKERDGLMAGIGAVAFEQAQSAKADERIREALKGDVVKIEDLMQKRDGGSAISKRIASFRLFAMKGGERGRFLSYFKAIESASLLDVLNGERAARMVERYKAVTSLIEKKKSEASAIRKHVELHGSKDSSKKPSEAESLFERSENEYTESLVAYGMYLFENATKWIGDDTTDEELSIISSLLTTQDFLESQTKAINDGKKSLEIDDLNALIKSNDGRIEALRSEVERIESQISDIERENDSIREKIRKVRSSEDV